MIQPQNQTMANLPLRPAKVVRLAIVASHPVQYYAPWFSDLAGRPELLVKVFYLWDFGVSQQTDPKFQQKVSWDINLLDGYAFEWVPNQSKSPGTGTFGGLHNPSLRNRLNAWNPDAILTFGYGWRSLLTLALRRPRASLILRGDTHLLGRGQRSRTKELLRGIALRWLFSRYAAFVVVGAANRDFYRKHGVPESRVVSVPHCIDNTRFSAVAANAVAAWRNRHGYRDNEFVILFAGKFERKKRPDLLLRAFQCSELPEARLALLGNGPLRNELASAIQHGPRSDQVALLPFHNQTEMPAALAGADLVVLPSQGPGETWGLIVNEAMACGTPVIVSDHVGCAADLVIEASTGWTVPAGDEARLRSALEVAVQYVRADPDGFRRRTRETISKYSYQMASCALLQLLEKIGMDTASPSS